MKQKLAVARAMMHRPQLLFLDEPTAGLDVVSAVALRDDLATLAACEGVTIFLTTHNMAEAEKLCSRVAVIRHGRLMADGSPDELRAQTGGPQIEIAGDGFNEDMVSLLRARPEVAAAETRNKHLTIHLREEMDVSPLVSLVIEAGGRVEEVRRGKASLEDVFLALMEEEE